MATTLSRFNVLRFGCSHRLDPTLRSLLPADSQCRAPVVRTFVAATQSHPPPPPGPPRGAQQDMRVKTSASFSELTKQLVDLDLQLKPTPEMLEQKMWIMNTLKPLFEQHSGGNFHLFGSCENGFWMNGSDIDACLVMRRCTLRPAWLTKLRLVQFLMERDRLGSAEVVSGARVPVAKVRSAAGVDLCDVSVNNVAALENSRFVAALAHIDPRVQCLGRFIKHWASRRRINNRSEGTLSTYTLILQLFYSLQLRSPPLLPLVTQILSRPSGPVPGSEVQTGCGAQDGATSKSVNMWFPSAEMDDNTGVMRPLPFFADAQSIRESSCFPELDQNEESLGELLHGFFQLWGREEFRGDEGRGQTVLVLDATQEPNDLGVLVMRCPLTGKNVNPFTTTVWRAIHAEFERALHMLQQGKSLEEMCEAAEESPAGRPSRRQKVPEEGLA